MNKKNKYFLLTNNDDSKIISKYVIKRDLRMPWILIHISIQGFEQFIAT